MNNTVTNIIVSGWPSTGGSTQARLLAILLDMKYIYAGGVLKHWGKQMGYDPSTDDINTWAKKYHKSWDFFWEAYVARKIINSENTLFEGKTAGFMIDDPKIFKIFIKASSEARAKRAKTDNRKEEIEKRDKFLAKEWFDRFGFNIFDEKLIKERYDLVIDTSDLGISEIAKNILTHLYKARVKNFNLDNKLQSLSELMTDYKKSPKILMNILLKRSLIITPEDIFKEVNDKYPELLENLPNDMREAIA